MNSPLNDQLADLSRDADGTPVELTWRGRRFASETVHGHWHAEPAWTSGSEGPVRTEPADLWRLRLRPASGGGGAVLAEIVAKGDAYELRRSWDIVESPA